LLEGTLLLLQGAKLPLRRIRRGTTSFAASVGSAGGVDWLVDVKNRGVEMDQVLSEKLVLGHDVRS
jgi:hypothetical protein